MGLIERTSSMLDEIAAKTAQGRTWWLIASRTANEVRLKTKIRIPRVSQR